MALITSTWRASLAGGIVLLDWGELMAYEPKLVPAGKVQPITPARASHGSFRGRGNVTHTLRFQRTRIFATDDAAREFLLAHVAAVPVCEGPLTLTIEVRGGGTATIETAVVQSMGEPTTENCRFLADYTVVGGSFNYVPAPVSGPIPTLGTPSGDVLDLGGGIGLKAS